MKGCGASAVAAAFEEQPIDRDDEAILRDRALREKEKVYQEGARQRDLERKGFVEKDEKKGMPRAEFIARVGESAGAAFDEFDTDQSGILSRQRWLRIFETVDTNGNGCVTVKEFEDVFGSGTWAQFDETGSNEIDQDAWLTVMGWYGRRKKSIAEIEVQKVDRKNRPAGMTRRQFVDKVGKHMFQGRLNFEDIDLDKSGKIAEDEWLKAFDELDTDGDGSISREEWEAKFGRGTFDKWDVDGSGDVDLEEWKAILAGTKKPKPGK